MRSFLTAALMEFHDALGDEVGRGNARLRLRLHREEHRELHQELSTPHPYFGMVPRADEDVDRHKLARELADVVYVAYGTAHAFDIDLDAALLEIHRAAMSKLEPPCADCDGTGIGGYDDVPGVETRLPYGCDVCRGTGKGERVIREDGKVMKPPGFAPPDMAKAVR